MLTVSSWAEVLSRRMDRNFSVAFGSRVSSMAHSYGSSGSLSSLLSGSSVGSGAPKITRNNLAEQLREYQKRRDYDWAVSQFFRRTSNSRRGANARGTIHLWAFFLGVLLLAAMAAFHIGYSALAWFYLALAAGLLLVAASVLSRKWWRKSCGSSRQGGLRLLP
eukprot:TRINITY_DN32488_c0_g1_i1.p1 TRINITY_DN32488_c0_g1~~TRINITY_DN32488_c0_g1_i1.p1  ORF type:complete len:164 (+),score=12.27 TRINITY_DN32488_c0_g1_i1:330-821(+)